eukprot:187678-Pelagomonas_calceolata.AAC.1
MPARTHAHTQDKHYHKLDKEVRSMAALSGPYVAASGGWSPSSASIQKNELDASLQYSLFQCQAKFTCFSVAKPEDQANHPYQASCLSPCPHQAAYLHFVTFVLPPAVYAWFSDDHHVWLVLEYCEGGDLFKAMANHGGRLDAHYVCVEDHGQSWKPLGRTPVCVEGLKRRNVERSPAGTHKEVQGIEVLLDHGQHWVGPDHTEAIFISFRDLMNLPCPLMKVSATETRGLQGGLQWWPTARDSG